MTTFTFAHLQPVLRRFEAEKGEEPPMTRSVGIMTDTDNTGEKVHAYYGDISFQRAARP